MWVSNLTQIVVYSVFAEFKADFFIPFVTHFHQVDFDQLQENLCQMERRCKASWDHLKVIAKHEMKPQLKQKMSDFLKDSAERIIILKIVHRRLLNRSCSFPPGEILCCDFMQ